MRAHKVASLLLATVAASVAAALTVAAVAADCPPEIDKRVTVSMSAGVLHAKNNTDIHQSGWRATLNISDDIGRRTKEEGKHTLAPGEDKAVGKPVVLLPPAHGAYVMTVTWRLDWPPAISCTQVFTGTNHGAVGPVVARGE